MNTSRRCACLTAGLLACVGALAVADGTRVSTFTPLTSSAGPAADEAVPIAFGSADVFQLSIADRATQLAAGKRVGIPRQRAVPQAQRWR